MNASKENCRLAQAYLTDEAVNMSEEAANHMLAFLAAAEKKLPSEKAFKKEKETAKIKRLQQKKLLKV